MASKLKDVTEGDIAALREAAENLNAR